MRIKLFAILAVLFAAALACAGCKAPEKAGEYD